MDIARQIYTLMTSHSVYLCVRLHVVMYPEVSLCVVSLSVCVCVFRATGLCVYVCESVLCAAVLQGQQHTAARQRCDSDGSLAPGHSWEA